MPRRCVFEGHETESCPAIPEGGLPICPKHLDMVGRELRFAIAPHLRENFIEKGEEAFLFNRKNGEVYSVNSTGAFIFRGLLAGKEFGALLEEMAGEFSFESLLEVIEGCRSFIGELKRLGLEESVE